MLIAREMVDDIARLSEFAVVVGATLAGVSKLDDGLSGLGRSLNICDQLRFHVSRQYWRPRSGGPSGNIGAVEPIDYGLFQLSGE